ncbi:MAG: STAS/SEC14 domain-containing protein [Planctomycetaceae bacterium]|nr:STAS/SEC14 domain-containing protein [Planctomycetaceae bacterium]
MTCMVTEIADGKVIEVELTGKLTKEAYEVFVPATEAQIEKHGKVRMLVILSDFHGWDMGALWEDLKFDVKHFNHIEKLAIVGESKWEKGMALFCRPFTTASIKYFDKADLDAARTWIQE